MVWPFAALPEEMRRTTAVATILWTDMGSEIGSRRSGSGGTAPVSPGW
jgi:hypothetical protein